MSLAASATNLVKSGITKMSGVCSMVVGAAALGTGAAAIPAIAAMGIFTQMGVGNALGKKVNFMGAALGTAFSLCTLGTPTSFEALGSAVTHELSGEGLIGGTINHVTSAITSLIGADNLAMAGAGVTALWASSQVTGLGNALGGFGKKQKPALARA